jgi:hypothetical protein
MMMRNTVVVSKIERTTRTRHIEHDHPHVPRVQVVVGDRSQLLQHGSPTNTSNAAAGAGAEKVDQRQQARVDLVGALRLLGLVQRQLASG